MGGKHSVIINSLQVKNVAYLNCIQFVITPPANVNMLMLAKIPSLKFIRFSYTFCQESIRKRQPSATESPEFRPQSLKELKLTKDDKKNQSFQSTISCKQNWSSDAPNQSVLMEFNDGFDIGDFTEKQKVSIKKIVNQKIRSKNSNVKYVENQIHVSITIDNLSQLRKQQQLQNKIIPDNQMAMHERQNYGRQNKQLEKTPQGADLQSWVFARKSYSTRSILRDIINELYYVKGIKQYVIACPQQLQNEHKPMKDIFIKKIVEVFYELNMKIEIQNQINNQLKGATRQSGQSCKIEKNSDKVCEVRVYLLWSGLQATYLKDEIKEVDRKCQITISNT